MNLCSDIIALEPLRPEHLYVASSHAVGLFNKADTCTFLLHMHLALMLRLHTMFGTKASAAWGFYRRQCRACLGNHACCLSDMLLGVCLHTQNAQHKHVMVDAVNFIAFSLKPSWTILHQLLAHRLSSHLQATIFIRCQACLYVGARLPAT